MNHPSTGQTLPAAQQLANKAFSAIDRFLHIEAVSGIVLLISAAIALVWANSSAAEAYAHFWHTPLAFSFGDYVIAYPLHFWINDALMTVFFLVVGMEIRREIHDGSLSSLKMATLPVAAALGGVLVPALIYLGFNGAAGLRQGWAVPTATDIAFAVGVLALLGKTIPAAVRIFLLALAIIDDIIAVLIIALFYSGGLDPLGFLIAGAGIIMVFGFQKIGLGSAYAYILPGALLWFGLLQTGAHPTLAGVILGLMTPAVSLTSTENTMANAAQALKNFSERITGSSNDVHELVKPVKQLEEAQRELLPPVLRVQMTLHPWVAYIVMPLFALANAGVNIGDINLAVTGTISVISGITLALLIGKPLGIIVSSWIMVRQGWCQLPAGMNWQWMWLIGCLAGIGFTMSIFIANLAFADALLLGAAKLGVLTGSLLAGITGLALGYILVKRHKNTASVS